MLTQTPNRSRGRKAPRDNSREGTTAKTTPRARIGADLPEPARAIYIDFEGNEDKRPTLLGVLWPRGAHRPGFEQYVFEETFFGAADVSGRLRAELPERVAHIVRVATTDNLEIVAWSEHELNMVKKWAPDSAEGFSARYRNAIPIARQWRRQLHPDVALKRTRYGGSNALASYMKLVGHQVSSSHGPLNTGARLTELRKQLTKKGLDFTRVTPVGKRKWTNLLKHNRHDCVGMRCVDERAVRELTLLTRTTASSRPDGPAR